MKKYFLVFLLLFPVFSLSQTKDWIRVYGYGFYDTRWDNANLFLTGYYGQSIIEKLSVYGNLSLSKDSKSIGGLYPIIFNDNYFSANIGFRYNFKKNLWIDLQSGLVWSLIDRYDKDTFEPDFRVQAIWGDGIYKESYFLDFYSSLGYYTRYDNSILYLMGRAGIPIWEVQVYGIARLASDYRADFYNNLGELGLGVRYVVVPQANLVVGVEYLRGMYFDSNLRKPIAYNPYEKFYDSVRIYATFDLNWTNVFHKNNSDLFSLTK